MNEFEAFLIKYEIKKDRKIAQGSYFMRIFISKYSDWSVEVLKNSIHPEAVAIRNIISNNCQHSFILLGDGTKFEHSRSDCVSFFNTKQDNLISYLLSFFIKIELSFLMNPSIIISLGTINMIPFTISRILTRSKSISVVTAEIWYSIKTLPKPFKKVFAFLLKVTFQKSDVILTLSKSIREELVHDLGISPEKVVVYSYEISKIFNSEVSKDKKLLLNPKGPIILTVCRISPEKGLIYLIEASRIIVEKVPNAKIIIKGASPGSTNSNTPEKRYEAKLRELIKMYGLEDNVIILEGSPNSEIPKFMSAADVFVLPSISEGLGLVILEALATGVPIVASNVGGIRNILINAHNGLLVQPRDVEGLANAVLTLLNDEGLRKRIIEDGLRTVCQTKDNEFEKILSEFISKFER